MENNLKNLSEVFKGCYFRIPDYQRGYSWEKGQLEQFWEDIENISSQRNVHYMGVLTVEKVSENEKKRGYFENDFGANNSETYYLVDGQQRLTTIIVLLNCLICRAESLGLEFLLDDEITDVKKKYLYKNNRGNVLMYIFGYTIDNPSSEFFKTKILGNSSSENKDVITLYTKNLEEAQKFFTEKIKNFNNDTIESYYKIIVEQLKFNLYEIGNDLDVFVIFEAMNNRGKKLSNLELLKNRLIYLSTKFESSEDEQRQLRNDINNTWKNIYEYLGKNPSQKLDDDDFLKNHWIMYFKYDRSQSEAFAKFLLNEYFTLKQVNEKALCLSHVSEYVKNLQESIKNWYLIHNPNKLNGKMKIYLDQLNRIGFGAFKPLIMAILNNKTIALDNEFLDLLSIMEKFIFLMFKISQRRSNYGDSEFYRNANEFFKNEIRLSDIKKTTTVNNI